ncbi:hypothetical protein GFM44_37420 [Rhizobium leguminosarum bv. viciae]|nr:hypothetical protein [Rhizobium leguminosarum bv. viciae]
MNLNRTAVALCRGSTAYRPAADARDKPEHDERGAGSHRREPPPGGVFLWRHDAARKDLKAERIGLI